MEDKPNPTLRRDGKMFGFICFAAVKYQPKAARKNSPHVAVTSNL